MPYQSDSFVKEIGGKQTGFFHVERQGDTWWAIDPLGRGFVPLGVDHASFHGHGCEKLGYAPYGRKNQAKYGSPAPWANETLDRLRAWGFNLLGAGCSTELHHRGLAHTEFLAIGSAMAGMGDAMNILPDGGVPGSAFPNVFHPDFEAFCRYRASQDCPPHVNDPWLFGYFLDNELAWWGQQLGPQRRSVRRRDEQVGRPHGQAGAPRFPGPTLRQQHHPLQSGMGHPTGVVRRDPPNATAFRDRGSTTVAADKKAFVALIADRYFGAITRAIRAADPNHMILGCRFAGGYASDGVWQAAGRYCDIVTFNYYGNVDLDKGIARDDTYARRGKPLVTLFEKFYDAGRRPMMVTEWSFPALDAGVPSIHGAGQRFRTQAERTKATEITARTMLALPFLIGYDYFMWVDEPALGVSAKFPEDSNYGLVNEDGKPYELLTAAFDRRTPGCRPAAARGAGRRRRGDRRFVARPFSCSHRFLPRPVASPASGATPHPVLRFERHGDAFLATNGPLEIRGKNRRRGSHRRGAAPRPCDGPVQRHGPTVRRAGTSGPNVERLVDVQATVGPAAMTLDLVGRYDAPPQSGRQSFEIAYRLTLLPHAIGSLPNCSGAATRAISRWTFAAYSSGSTARSPARPRTTCPPASIRPPRLWGSVEGDAWLDEKAGAFWGLAIDDADLLKIHFWLDDRKTTAPRCHVGIGAALAPEETYRPATPVGVLCVAGRGDRLQWQISSPAGAAVARLPLIWPTHYRVFLRFETARGRIHVLIRRNLH